MRPPGNADVPEIPRATLSIPGRSCRPSRAPLPKARCPPRGSGNDCIPGAAATRSRFLSRRIEPEVTGAGGTLRVTDRRVARTARRPIRRRRPPDDQRLSTFRSSSLLRRQVRQARDEEHGPVIANMRRVTTRDAAADTTGRAESLYRTRRYRRALV